MSQEYKIKLADEQDLSCIPDDLTLDDLRYFEDKLKRHPDDKKFQLQVQLIKQHLGVQ